MKQKPNKSQTGGACLTQPVRARDDRWNRYHISDLRDGDIATMRNQPNAPTGILAFEESLLTLNVTDGSRPAKWIIFPDSGGWVTSICDAQRPNDPKVCDTKNEN